MRRTLHTTLAGTLSGPTTVYAIVAAAAPYRPSNESLQVTVGGRPARVTPLDGPHGTRLHRFGQDTVTSQPVPFSITYDATIHGIAPGAPVDPADLPVYLRPSRYCESDRVIGLANERFGRLAGRALADAVCDWVRDTLEYAPGSTGPSDSATDVLRTRRGVCRDYAHLVISLLRARSIPARFVSVWAPGLQPMEFHAVAEAYIDGSWVALDPTDLAPRTAMARIATGRDAADTAFLSSYGAGLHLQRYLVRADIDEPAVDDHRSPVILC